MKDAWREMKDYCTLEDAEACEAYNDPGLLGVLPILAVMAGAVLMVGLVLRAVAIYLEGRR